MPRGRKNKRKILKEIPAEQVVQPKKSRTTVQPQEKGESSRSTRSTARTTAVSKEAAGKSTNNSTIFQGVVIPDPRTILYGKGRNNNAQPGVSLDELVKGKQGEIQSQMCEQTSPVSDTETQQEKSTCDHLREQDPGTELDYEDNLDVQLTVSRPAETEDGTNTDEEESTLLSMLKTNPKLKRIFRRLVHDEQTTEKEQAAGNNVQDGKQVEKSLSDTTIYAPALVRKDPQLIASSPILRNRLQPCTNTRNTVNEETISRILEGIRLQPSAQQPRVVQLESSQADPQPSTSQAEPLQHASRTQDELDAEAVQHARRIAQDKIVEAEKFRAAIDVGPGTFNPDNNDDAFFMNTCHTDETESGRISKGSFCRSE